MKNVVVRLMVVFALAALITLPALANQTSQASFSRHSELVLPQTANAQIAAEPIQLANGPDPVPWPKAVEGESEDAKLGKLVADGSSPVPWPKAVASEPEVVNLPMLVAEGGNPVPWPKAVASEPEVVNLPMLVAEGGNPVPWPKMLGQGTELL
jgi:hypothetical protein